MSTYVLATAQIPRRSYEISRLPSRRPLRWLRQGFDDLIAAPITGLLYGVAVAALALLIATLTAGGSQFYLVPFIVGGFLILGPILLVGLMATAKSRERHTKPTESILRILAANGSALGLMGLFLLLIFANWIMLSNLLFGGVFHEVMPTYEGVQPLPVMFGESWPFALVYGGIALVLALLVFRITALSLPMLVDQRVDALNAVFASWRAVGENWPAMGVWALLIAGLVTIGMLTYAVGLIIVTPLLGYASWHAYRDTLIPQPTSSPTAETRG